MNQQRLFRRKISYFVAIAVLLFPLYLLSQPATTASQGGKLARLRSQYSLSQANLGKIDPTSASMKLATFGMHGFATNILWTKAIDYKEREDYTNFDTALQQITYLQPHYVKVWEFQGHNVAFNISVEFDDYRDRYHYVIKGFNLLKKGISFNEKEPRLLRSLAHFTGFKIGRSDEQKLYRPMFYDDNDYHAPPRDQNPLLGTRYQRPETIRDNWLVSKWWYKEAEKLIDNKLVTYGTMNPFLLHSDPAKQQMQYAETLEKEGHFGEIAKQAWQRAAQEWDDYSVRLIPTSGGLLIRLVDEEKYRKMSEELYEQLMSLEPGLREALVQKELDGLTPEEQGARQKPAEQRTADEARIAQQVEARMRIRPAEVAAAMSDENRSEGLQLAERHREASARHRMIERYRDTINFTYWKRRCQFEQSPDAISARESVFLAKQAYRDTDLPGARKHFDGAIALWKKVLDQYPFLLDEETLLRDLYEMIEGYQEVLAQTSADGSRELPDDFPLMKVVELWREKTAEPRTEAVDSG